MSPNYINYTGGLQRSPNHQDSSAFESLTGSLICPGPQTPLQQSYPQTWQNGQVWPNYAHQSSEYRAHYQQPSIDNGGYFNNQEYIPYDEAEDFYDNGHADTVGVIEQGVEMSNQSGSLSLVKGSNASIPNELSSSTLETDEQRRVHNGRSEVATSKPDLAAINDRAAELRAKLLATKRGSTPGTPTNFKKSVRRTPKCHDGSSGSTEALKSDTEKTLDISGRRLIPVVPKTDDTYQSSSVMQVDGSSDIDVLFAEARAANAASTAGTGVNQNPSNEDHIEKRLNGTNTKAALNPKAQSEATMNKNHQLLNKNGSPSDASKLGEIHHRQSQTARAPGIEHPKSKSSGHKGQPSDGKLNRRNAPENSPKNQAAGGTGTIASSRPESRAREISPQLREALNVHQSPVRASVPQYRENRQAPKADYRRERSEQSQLPQDARYEQQRDPKYHSDHWENHSSAHSQQASHAHTGEAERISADRQRYDEYNFQASSKMVENNARAAAMYKKELEDKARQMGSFRGRIDKADKVGPVTANDNRGVGERLGSTSTAIKAAENPIDNRLKNERAEDLEDWLKLTGYYDIQLRNQRLALFRELKAADAHRAELQRQAEQLGIAHTQSGQPQETNETTASRSINATQSIRASSTIAMPPPSVPSQEDNDDIGIKIKNSANRENLSSPRKLKRVHADDDPESGQSQSKLQRLDSNGCNEQSRPQLSSAPTRREQKFSEDRVLVDNRNYRMRSRERSRSPQARRRSLSPTSRPRERHPSPNRMEAGSSKSEKAFHESISKSREFEQRPLIERDIRHIDYNPRWNSYRPNAHYNQDTPNSNYRGHGRGGSGGYHSSARRGFNPYQDGGETHFREQLGSASLNLGAGG